MTDIELLRVAEQSLVSLLLLWDRTRESGVLPIEYIRCATALRLLQIRTKEIDND